MTTPYFNPDSDFRKYNTAIVIDKCIFWCFSDGLIIKPTRKETDDPLWLGQLRLASIVYTRVDRIIREIHKSKIVIGHAKDADGIYETIEDKFAIQAQANDIYDNRAHYSDEHSIGFTLPIIALAQVAREHSHGNRPGASGRFKYAGYIYLLQSPTSAYKIGRAKNPFDRLGTFNVKLPFEVEFVHLIPSNNMMEAEKILHDKFAEKRINGEWFKLDPDDVEYIKGIEQL